MNYFPENLSKLRRRAGYTQESLAEVMGISRQAVSKWESGQAMPEAAALVDLADLLGCSLDQLMRQEVDELVPATEDGITQADMDLFQAYDAIMDRFSWMIAGGVALILLGVAALLAANLRWGESGLMALPLLACVTVAVFLFMMAGMARGDFQKENPTVPNLHTPEELEEFGRRFRLGMALAVAGILADVTLLIVLEAKAMGVEVAQERAVILFFVLLALCVGAIVYLGLQKERFEGAPREEEDPVAAKWGGVIMLSATAIFLLLGFLRDAWDPGWVVFPVGGILCAIVSVVRKKN